MKRTVYENPAVFTLVHPELHSSGWPSASWMQGQGVREVKNKLANRFIFLESPLIRSLFSFKNAHKALEMVSFNSFEALFLFVQKKQVL